MGKYHEVLGIAEGATEAEINSAFKKLAKKFHPDVNKDDPEAENKFKEINEAADGLKKGKSGPEDQRPQGNPGGFGWGGTPWSGFHDAFRDFGRNPHSPFQQTQAQVHESVAVPLETFIKGGVYKFVVNVGMQKFEHDITLEPDTAVGTLVVISLPEIKNVVFNIHLLPISTNNIEIHGINLVIPTRINVFDALLGVDKIITLPDDKQINMTVPCGVQPNTLLRVVGKGLHQNNKRGDVFIKIELEVPRINEEQRDKIKEFLEETGIN